MNLKPKPAQAVAPFKLDLCTFPVNGFFKRDDFFCSAIALPLPRHRQIAFLSEARDALIDATAVPLSISIEIQEPVSGRGSEQTDLAGSGGVPVARYGQTKGSDTPIDTATIQSAVAIEVKKPLAGSRSEHTDLAFARSVPVPGNGDVSVLSKGANAAIAVAAIPSFVAVAVQVPAASFVTGSGRRVNAEIIGAGSVPVSDDRNQYRAQGWYVFLFPRIDTRVCITSIAGRNITLQLPLVCGGFENANAGGALLERGDARRTAICDDNTAAAIAIAAPAGEGRAKGRNGSQRDSSWRGIAC